MAPSASSKIPGLHIIIWCSALLSLLVLGTLYFMAPKPESTSISWDAVRLTNEPPIATADLIKQIKAIAGLGEEMEVSPITLKQVFDAAARHGWVESVQRTRWMGKLLEIELTYRQPVARIIREEKEYIVDRQGQMLLTLGMKESAEKLPLLEGFPPGQLSPKDTELLKAAARAAYLIKGDAQKWNVNKVVVSSQTQVLLFTQSGSCIWWQTVNAEVPVPEAKEEEKLARLRMYAEQQGNLEVKEENKVIDVRPVEGLQVVGRAMLFVK